MAEKLRGCVLAMLVGDGFPAGEVDALRERFRAAGARVHFVSPGGDRVASDGRLLECDADAHEIHARYYDALVVPGGAQGRTLAEDERIAALVREFRLAVRPLGALGEGVLVLAAAGVVRGERICAPVELCEEVRRAGGACVEGDVSTDRLIVTAPDEERLAAFADALVAEVAEVRRRDRVDEQSLESFPASDAQGGGVAI